LGNILLKPEEETKSDNKGIYLGDKLYLKFLFNLRDNILCLHCKEQAVSAFYSENQTLPTNEFHGQNRDSQW
jgi:hypothetical protein